MVLERDSNPRFFRHRSCQEVSPGPRNPVPTNCRQRLTKRSLRPFLPLKAPPRLRGVGRRAAPMKPQKKGLEGELLQNASFGIGPLSLPHLIHNGQPFSYEMACTGSSSARAMCCGFCSSSRSALEKTRRPVRPEDQRKVGRSFFPTAWKPKPPETNGCSNMAIEILYIPLHRKWLFGETSICFWLFGFPDWETWSAGVSIPTC